MKLNRFIVLLGRTCSIPQVFKRHNIILIVNIYNCFHVWWTAEHVSFKEYVRCWTQPTVSVDFFPNFPIKMISLDEDADLLTKFSLKEISGWYLRIKSHSKKHLVKSVFCRRDHCLNSKSYSLNTILWFLAVKLKPSKLELIVQVQLMFKLQIIWRHPFCIPTDYSSCPFAVVSNSEHCDKLVKFITDAPWVILPSLSQASWTDNHWSLKSFYHSFSQNLLNSKRCSNVTISS